jgi:hypothetical protein
VATRAPRPAENTLLATFVDEEETRATRTSPIEVTQLEIGRDDRDQVLALPGTVTFYLGYRGSAAMATLRQLVQTPRTRPTAADLKRLLAFPPRETPVSKVEAVRAVQREPILADIRYAGKTLVSRVLIAQKTKLTVAVCPYNGGRLNASSFRLVERVKEGRAEALDAVAITCAPPLTPAERAAADKVRDEESEMNIGVALSERMCETIGLFLLGIVAGAAVWAAVDHFTNSWNGIIRNEEIYDPVDMSSTEIDRRGPIGSARTLLQRRRRLLLQRR